MPVFQSLPERNHNKRPRSEEEPNDRVDVLRLIILEQKDKIEEQKKVLEEQKKVLEEQKKVLEEQKKVLDKIKEQKEKDETTPVIATVTGKCFHTKTNCGNSRSHCQITMAEAKRKSLRACLKCASHLT